MPIERIELHRQRRDRRIGGASDGDGRHASLSHDLRIDESCWIAVRASGPEHELVLDPDGAFAHTSPVYVTVAGAPIAKRDDAAYFVEWIDRLIAVTEAKARFPSAADRDRVHRPVPRRPVVLPRASLTRAACQSVGRTSSPPCRD